MDPDEPNTKSNTNHLKIEWSLFWEGLLGDNDSLPVAKSIKTPQDAIRLLPKEKIPNLIKDLSFQRRELHKQIEKLNKEIELNSTKLESLKLVGSDSEEVIQRIHELSDRGQELSLQLDKLDQKLKWVRDREKETASDQDLA